MTRPKKTPSSHKRRKKVLKSVKGQRAARSRLYRTAKVAQRRSLAQSYVGRKQKKRNFRALWITRISAACKAEDISYSKFISGLKNAGILLNRKMLSELAIRDNAGFKKLVEKAKA